MDNPLQRENQWREEEITREIRSRIVAWCEGERLNKENGQVLKTRIERFSRDFGRMALGDDMKGWECGIAQILDTSNSKVCRYLPYILTAYMYNYRRGVLYTRLGEKRNPVKEFHDALNKERQRGEYLNFSNDAYLGIKEMPGKPLLFLETMLLGVQYEENITPSEEDKAIIDAYARQFVLPKMKASEMMMLSLCGPAKDIKENNRCALSHSALDIADWFLGWYNAWTHGETKVEIDWVWSFLLLYGRLFGIEDELWGNQENWEKMFSDTVSEIKKGKAKKESLSRRIETELENEYYEMKSRLKQEKEILRLTPMPQRGDEEKIAEIKSVLTRLNPAINECEDDEV